MTTLQCGERECRAPQLTEKELEQKVKEAPLWELSPDRKSISRTFVAKNFAEGLKFFNAVAQLAEEWNHHPDLHLTDYRTVRVVLSTHAIQGLSALDFSLAARIDKIDVAYSPKWLRENPLPSPVCMKDVHKDVFSDEDHEMIYLETENPVDGELQMPSTPTATALSGNRGVDALKGCPELVPLPELQMKMKAVPHWQLSPDQRSISRTFIAKNFSEGIKFFNAVAQLVEAEGHHPDEEDSHVAAGRGRLWWCTKTDGGAVQDLHLTDYRTVSVVLSTQSLGGLSSLDFTMAQYIDTIDVHYSPKWLHQQNGLTLLEPGIKSKYLGKFRIKSPHERQRELAVAAMQSTAPLQKSKQDIAPSMLLHSLYLVFVQAGMVGLTAQEAAAEITQKNLPGLKEKSAKIGPHSVQVAKAICASPEFTEVDEFGKYALRRSLLKAFRQGTLEPTSYFEQKRLEASLLEKYTL